MKIKDYRYTGKKPVHLQEIPTGSCENRDMKDELILRTEENLERLMTLQEKLYADGREGLVVVLQAMDAAGKDSMIKHVMSGMNPQGVDVYPFKAPTAAELGHDYLWRVAAHLPARGKIAIFNRSHYEDVVAVQVRGLEKTLKLPARCLTEDFYDQRYRQIRDFEEYLYENGYRVLKIFLHVSAEEQKKRFLERLDRQEKNWKFDVSDLSDRAKWDSFQDAYEKAINETATRHSPWYVIPADDKWFSRYLVSEALLRAMDKIDPQYPELSEELARDLPEYRRQLEEEIFPAK